jgi:hypothetical protein
MSIEDRLLAELAQAKGVSVTALRMSMAVDDATMAAIVQDHRQSPTVPSSAIPVASKNRRVANAFGGWVDPAPLSQPYVRECDAIAESFARSDAAELRRRLGGGG